MLVNTKNIENTHVRFVSYTGKYPNLCRGVLILNIDGEECKFGHDYAFYSCKTDSFTNEKTPNHEIFWKSGGNIANYCAREGEWIIDINKLPEKYREYATLIDKVFNDNVPHGCCGGCI